MSMALNVFQLLIIHVFSWLCLGMALNFFTILPAAWFRAGLRYVVLYFLVPCFMFEKILNQMDYSDSINVLYLSAAAVIMVLGACLITWAQLRWLTRQKGMHGSILLCGSFNNYGFIVYPLVLNMFGEKALALTFSFTLPTDALLWSLGIYLLQNNKKDGVKWREVFSPPFIVFMISLGLAFGGARSHMPDVIFSILKFPGYLTIPTALICIGGLFYESFRGSSARVHCAGEVLRTLLTRTVILPLIWVVIIGLFIHHSPVREILLIEAIMPASMGTVALISIYGGHQVFGVIYSSLSNIISIITIPLYWAFIKILL